MTCSIVRDNKGKITSVLNKQGEPSKLFDQLNASPFIPSVELAANIAISAIDKYSDNPIVFEDENGREFPNMETLLLEGKRGNVFAKTTTGQQVFRLSLNSGTASVVADGIQQGLIQDQKTITEDGQIAYIGKGLFFETQKQNAELFANLLAFERGYPQAVAKQEMIIPGKHLESVYVENEQGELEVVPLQQVKDNPEKYKGTEQMLRDMEAGQEQTNVLPKSRINTARQNLLGVLRSLGISTSTLEDYHKKFQAKHGKEPTVMAIADLANQVVAFAQGQDTIENLSEETVHVLLEAYNEQASITEALMEVAETPEYAEFAETYRTLYGKELQGVALEDKIRKEILGKIIAKEVQKGFQSEVRQNIWQRILNYLRARFTPSKLSIIQKINQDVLQAIETQDLSKFRYDLSSNESFWYSAIPQKYKAFRSTILDAKNALEDLIKTNQIKSEKFNLDRIDEDKILLTEQELELMESVAIITGIAERQISDVQRKIRNAETTGKDMDPIALTIADKVDAELIPFMREFSDAIRNIQKETIVKDQNYQKRLSTLLETIAQVERANNELQPEIKRRLEERQGEIFDREHKDANISPDFLAKRRKKFFEGGDDMTWYGKFLGIISDAVDPAVQLVHKVVSDVYTAARVRFLEVSRPFIDMVEKEGLMQSQESIIQKGTHFYLSPVNEAKEIEDREKLTIKTIAELSEQDEKEVAAKLKAGKRVGELLPDDDKYLAFKEVMRAFDAEARNRRNKNSYYEQRDAKLNALQITGYTRSFLSSLSERRARIAQDYIGLRGVLDQSKMTKEDKRAYDQVSKDKKAAKSPLTATGQIRPGLKIAPYSELTEEDIAKLPLSEAQKAKLEFYQGDDLVVLADGWTKEMLDHETRTAFDINMLDYSYYLDEQQTNTTPSEFFQLQLEEFRRRFEETKDIPEEREKVAQEYKDFMENNMTIQMDSSVYEAYEERLTYKDAVEQAIRLQKDPAKKQRLENQYKHYKDLAREKKWLLKQNKKPHTLFQTDVVNLQEEARLRLLAIEDEMRETRKDMAIPRELLEQEDTQEFTTFIHEDFSKMAQDANMSEIDFAKKHMTERNKIKVENFERTLKGVFEGNLTVLPRGMEAAVKYYRESGRVDYTQIKTQEELLERLVVEFAKDRMASYMSQTMPASVKQAVDKLYTDPQEAQRIIKEDDSLIKIIPDYTWSAEIDNEAVKNKEFKAQKYGKQLGRKYQNDEFFDFFGINPEDWWALKTDDISQLKPTKNQKAFKLLVEAVRMREKALELQGESETVSKFQRPQMYKRRLEQITSVNTLKSLGTTIRDNWGEFTRSREDDMDYGDKRRVVTEGSNSVTVRNIPRYFTRRIEDPNMLTQDVISSELLALQAAYEYAEKKKSISDIAAIQRRVASNNYRPTGISMKSNVNRKGNASNTAKKVNEFVDYLIYGVKQTQQMTVKFGGTEVDLTKMISKVQGYSSFINLAGNLMVDVTGATTALINNTVDRIIGDYYTSESKSRANTTAAALMPNYLKNYKKLSQDDPMAIILESMGATGARERVENSRNRRGVRVLESLPFFASKLSNLTFTPSLVLASLMEMRYYKGNFHTFDDYRRIRLAEDPKLSQKQLRNDFKAIAKESFYDHFDITPAGLKPNTKFKQRFAQNTDQKFLEQLSKASAKTKKLAMQVDGVLNQEEQLAAQRNVLTATLLQHRGWLPLIISRGFKKGSYNLAMDKYEEGHYRTLFRTVFAMTGIKFKPEGGITYEVPEYKELFEGMSIDEKRNLRRAGLQMAITIALMVIGQGIDFDDEDDSDVELFAKLIYLRTTSEFNTQNLRGLGATVTEIYNNPVPSLPLFELVNPYTWGETWGETRRTTTGEKIIKTIKKYTPLKRLEQYQNLQDNINWYRFYNSPTLTYSSTLGLSLGSLDKPKRNKSETTVVSSTKIR